MDTKYSLKNPITDGKTFLDYSIEKNTTECPIECAICTKTWYGHPLCYQFCRVGNKLMEKKKYPVGCSHETFDGDPWCDNCATIVNNKPMCFDCVEHDWGTLKENKKNHNYPFMWVDGTESCINYFLQDSIKPIVSKYFFIKSLTDMKLTQYKNKFDNKFIFCFYDLKFENDIKKFLIETIKMKIGHVAKFLSFFRKL